MSGGRSSACQVFSYTFSDAPIQVGRARAVKGLCEARAPQSRRWTDRWQTRFANLVEVILVSSPAFAPVYTGAFF